MSKLREWREREGYSRQELADLLGAADAMTVFRWEQDPGSASRRIPAENFMVKIYATSRGLVDANSFYPLPALGQLTLSLDPAPVPPPAPLLEIAGEEVAAAETQLQDMAA